MFCTLICLSKYVMLNLPTNSLESCPVPVTAKGSWIDKWIELVGNCYSIENKGSDILNRYIERRRQIVCIGMAEEVIGYWMDAHLDTRASLRVDIIYWSCRKATYNRFRILFSIRPSFELSHPHQPMRKIQIEALYLDSYFSHHSWSTVQ